MKPRVWFVASDSLGGGLVRSLWPSIALKNAGFHSVSTLGFPNPKDTDTVIIHRPLALDIYERVVQYKEDGVRVLISEDDDLTRIYETKNQIGLDVWTEESQKFHDMAIQASDGLIVTTPRLGKVYEHLNSNIYLCPNYLPGWVSTLFYPKPYSSKARVGWSGITATHRHDLEWIAPVAKEMLKDAAFTTVGDVKTVQMLDIGGMENLVYPFQFNIEEVYRAMHPADIGIVPLSPIEFNQSKSWLKALEYMSLGIPVVASNREPQRALIAHGEDGFIADTPEEFAGYVQELVHDPEMRSEFSAKAKQKARTLSLENQLDCWKSCFIKEETLTNV